MSEAKTSFPSERHSSINALHPSNNEGWTMAAAARKQAGVSIHQATVQRILGDAQQ